MRKVGRIALAIGRGISYVVTGLIVLISGAIALFLTGALVIGVITGGSDNESEPPSTRPTAPNPYEPTGYPSGTGYPDEAGGEFDPTPEKINGEDSYEFEPDDLERAEEADEELREYCAGAVSPAQELGCLSHAEVP